MKMEEFMDEDLKYYQDEEQRKKAKKRSDLVSKKLGELLLQGYRMLNLTCDKCDCILMQKKNEAHYCVSCQDQDVVALDMEGFDCPVLRDNPMVCQTAECLSIATDKKLLNNEIKNEPINDSESVNVVRSKLAWAIEELKRSKVLSYDLELLEYVKRCSETILALNNAKI